VLADKAVPARLRAFPSVDLQALVRVLDEQYPCCFYGLILCDTKSTALPAVCWTHSLMAEQPSQVPHSILPLSSGACC
jgi:hypothetical protein